MKRTLSLLTLSLLLLSACSSGKDKSTDPNSDSTQESNRENSENESEATTLATKEKSCKDSGGSFKNGTCTCPSDTYGPDDTLIYTYNSKTGHCEDPDGAPGGILGEDGKGALLDPKDL
ncbi:hypothetical protein IPG41_05825 [Candidatus Peregrinibacteria bacterium]|nr:MAG: hypothetical protein IPG41_05825 [Candidatus Peregrinibacteria bacterium]